MNNIITYEQAQRICENYNHKNFFEKSTMMEGYKISFFNYFICDYNDFAYPLGRNSEFSAFEMRGLTFVFDKDGSLYKRYMMLPKFFNINQNEENQYHNIKNKKIKHITEKEDGSLIAFMMLPNGRIFPKTLGSVDNDQTKRAWQCLDSTEKIHWIRQQINDDYTPLFEYVSLYNRIVLKYDAKPELRLIGLRDNLHGEVILSPELSSKNIPFKTVKNITNITLDELIEKGKEETEKEGWVIQFEDGKLLKVKTDWYFEMHYIRTENVFREDFIIRSYLNEELDDVKSKIDVEQDLDAFNFIKKVTKAVDNFIEYLDNHVEKYFKIYQGDYQGDWEKFATENNKVPYFDLIVCRARSFRQYQERKVERIIFLNRKLQTAREFIEKWEN